MTTTTFASDNYAGAHPAVIEAVAAANDGHAPAYGNDPWTQRAEQVVRDHLGEQARAFFVFNGTGANVLALRAACTSWGAVICSETAHLQVDEGGAPERVGGVKLLTAPTPDGKLTPAAIERLCARLGDEHQAQPQVVSIANATELGTVYTPAEIRALADAAHARGLSLHVDGSRIAQAAVSLGLPVRAFTTDAGVDLLSFGATKLGAIGVEAVVVLNGEARFADGLPFLRKQSLQLASKGRFLAAQFTALFGGELWQELASHGNAMAARLAAGVQGAPGLEITQAVEANAVFAQLPREAIASLRETWHFYDWTTPGRAVPAGHGEVRWMCAWDVSEADVDRFAAEVRETLGALAPA
ncbi:MAG TPA: beta-eliminating lyase-related protein [Conexibacter sp.]|jgi:threonine aldolase